MRSTKRGLVTLSVVMMLALGTEQLNAGVLVDLLGPYGPVLDFDGTPADPSDIVMNNDNYVPGTGDPNLLLSGAELTVNGTGPVDFVIRVKNTNGTTEYFADFGTAFNESGADWTGYQFLLGTGVGGAFERLSAGSSYTIPDLDLDFDSKDVDPNTDIFDLTVWEEDRIVFEGGGTLPSGGTGVASDFYLDVPDLGVPTANDYDYEFTIRISRLFPNPQRLSCGRPFWASWVCSQPAVGESDRRSFRSSTDQ